MKIQLKDNSILHYDEAIRVGQLAQDISPGLGRAALGAVVNDEIKDLRYMIVDDAEVRIITFKDDLGKRVFWHSASHLLAQAVKRLYPEVKLAIGPAINNGFYYDFDKDEPFSHDDLLDIEGEMKKIVQEKLDIEYFELARKDAIQLMSSQGEDYKLELINDLPEDSVISFYKQGEFVDLCAGPHINNTKELKAFKLQSVAGAYWRGDEKNKMLTRIYGIAFPKQKELKEHLEHIEEAKKRDHRKLGKELDLFTIFDEGPGFPVFFNKGIILKDLLINYWKQVHKKHNYVEVSTPIIMNRSLWETSGHWDYYKENMYTTVIDDEDFAIKPMNCPGGMLAYKNKKHSYKDLPIRMAELGLVHRHEMKGALHGLMRVRSFTQDDAHIFMRREQVKDEIIGVMELIEEVYQKFDFKYHLELSTRPEKRIGDEGDWDLAEAALKEAMEEKDVDYVLNEGDGAFYGPKIDYHLEDSLGRTWQCGTIQLDFQLPIRFDLDYVDSDNSLKRPIMLHRVVYGSIERFLGILIEHFGGAFPSWLAPVQVKILPVSSAFNKYAETLVEELEGSDIRVEADYRDERIGYKIREAGLMKIPYLMIVGEKEENKGTVSLRKHGETKNYELSIKDFLETEINNMYRRL